MRNMLSSAVLLAIAGLAFSSTASAQSPNGFASIVHVPIVVNSGTYQSTIFVHNPNAFDVDVQINYHGAAGTGSVGLVDCGSHAITAGTTAEFDFGTVCTLTGGSTFGTMRIWETESTVRPIGVYTRVQAFTGNGFSIEGFPIGNFANDNGASVALGLRRQAAAPTYQSNCFVSSIGEPVSVDMKLFDGSNTQLGTTQTIAVDAFGTTRLSDVFAMAGAAEGDYSNVRAEFSQGVDTVGNPSFSAFCTVQNNTSFDADFRIAKTVTPDDGTALYTANQPHDAFGELLIVPAAMKSVFALFVRHPDFVSCRTVGSQVDNTEIRIIDPNGNVVAGGDNIVGTGEFFTGEKSTVNNGSNGMWRVEVGSRDGLGLEANKYNLQCANGNGANRPLLIGYLPDDF